MQFSKKTLISLVALALGTNAGVPIVSVELQSWEAGKGCDAGYPAHGEPKFKAAITASPFSCDKTTVNRQWDVDLFSLKGYMDTKEAFFCQGVEVYNTDDCSGKCSERDAYIILCLLVFRPTQVFPRLPRLSRRAGRVRFRGDLRSRIPQRQAHLRSLRRGGCCCC